MAYKVLGQAAPAADTDTTLYTVPASTETVVSSFVVANRGATSATFRMAVRVGGAALSSEQYHYYDVELPGNSTFVATTGNTLAATDVVTVRASTANLSFNLSGKEVAV